MTADTSAKVQKLWNYCDILRDDGVSYGDYVEQLTYLLFLKLDKERREAAEAFGETAVTMIPDDVNWESLAALSGEKLEAHYLHLLRELGRAGGMLGVIFRKAQNRITDPAKLKKLVTLIEEETWSADQSDLQGDLYEGLLEKNAQDTKSGAGQYFTPRPLIDAMVDVMRLAHTDTVHDPAAGTGGFLIAAYNAMRDSAQLDRAQHKRGVQRLGDRRRDGAAGRDESVSQRHWHRPRHPADCRRGQSGEGRKHLL